MGQFLPATPYTDMADTPRGTGYLHNLSREEVETLMQLGGLNVTQLIGEVIININIIILITMIDDVMTSVCNNGQVKRLQNIAYQLGQEESKEMTRGKYLNILRKKNSS